MPGYVMTMANGRGGRGGYMAGGRGGPAGGRGRGGVQQGWQQPKQAMPVNQPIAPMLQGAPTADIQALESTPVEDRKRLLGEQLYPLIAKLQPTLAGKITGMILESSDTKEVITLIERPAQLSQKVNEAIDVLNMHSGTTA